MPYHFLPCQGTLSRRYPSLLDPPKTIIIQNFDSSGSLTLIGPTCKVPTIRYQISASYYGGYDNYSPWHRFSSSMRTYIDCLDNVPVRCRKFHEDGLRELVNVWFLFLGNAYGLILIREKESLELSCWQRSSLNPIRTYKRIGVFEGCYCCDVMLKKLRLV